MRWDQVAYQAYGSTGYMGDLITANPDVPPYGWIPNGTQLACPVITDADLTPLAGSLPAWKQ